MKKHGFTELASLILFSYPLFYYAYKFGSPDFGNSDFYSYYDLYSDWNFKEVVSPFNMRLVSCYLVHLINKTGLFYSTDIAYNNPLISQRVFFSALLFNYICAILTAWTIFKMVFRFCGNRLYALLFGIAYFLGFGTLFYAINTLTESFSILLFSLIVFAYNLKSLWILPLLALSVLQREFIFLFMGLIAFTYCLSDKPSQKYHVTVFIASVAGFALYLALRTTVFFTPEHTDQMDFASYPGRLLHPAFPMGAYIRQSFFNQNIFIFYLCLITYKYFKKLPLDNIAIIIIISLYLQTNLVSFIALLSNSTGRYFYIASPLILLHIAKELKPLLKGQFIFKSCV